MSKFILTIIVSLAIVLTTMVYATSDSLEIKALITLLDLPIVYLIINHMENE